MRNAIKGSEVPLCMDKLQSQRRIWKDVRNSIALMAFNRSDTALPRGVSSQMTPPRQSVVGFCVDSAVGTTHYVLVLYEQGWAAFEEESDMINRIRRRRGMTFLARTRRQAQKMSPYLSLVLLLVPVALVEPLKLAALIFAGKGSLDDWNRRPVWGLRR